MLICTFLLRIGSLNGFFFLLYMFRNYSFIKRKFSAFRELTRNGCPRNGCQFYLDICGCGVYRIDFESLSKFKSIFIHYIST